MTSNLELQIKVFNPQGALLPLKYSLQAQCSLPTDNMMKYILLSSSLPHKFTIGPKIGIEAEFPGSCWFLSNQLKELNVRTYPLAFQMRLNVIRRTRLSGHTSILKGEL